MMLRRLILSVLLLGWFAGQGFAVDLPLPVNEVKGNEPISFTKQIMPLLQRSCLACHHAKEPEGNLILETHALMLKGGDSGAGIVANKSGESLVFTRATGQEEPLMPPEDNSVGAKPLTADELGLLKKWIDTGAIVDAPTTSESLAWQAIPESYRPIYSLTVSPDDQFVAYGEGNRVKVQHIPSWTPAGQLIDPAINKQQPTSNAAHLDLVQSLAFAPDGERIASGGYKAVKIWRRSLTPANLVDSPLTKATGKLAVAHSGKHFATIVGEEVEIWNRENNQREHALKTGLPNVSQLQWSNDDQWLLAMSDQGQLKLWQISNQQLLVDQASLPILQGLAASSSGKWLVGITPEKKPQAWTLEPKEADKPELQLKEKPIDAWQPIGPVNALAALPGTPDQLLFAGESGKAFLCDPVSGAITKTYEHGQPILSLGISADRLRMVTAAANGTIKVWTIASGEQALSIESDVLTVLAKQAAERNVNRQQANIQRLTSKIGELEKAATKETEAQTKAEEERKKVEAEVAAKKAEVDAAKKAMADHQQAIKDAQTAKEQAEKMIVEMTKKIEMLNGQNEAKQKAIETAQQNEAKSQESLKKQDQAVTVVKDAVQRAQKAITDQQNLVKQEQENLVKIQDHVKTIQPTKEFAAPVSKIAFANDNQSLIAFRAGQLWLHQDGGKRIENRLAVPWDAVDHLTLGSSEQIIATKASQAPLAWSLKPEWVLERTIGDPQGDVLSDRITMLEFSPDGKNLLVGSGPPSRFGDMKLFSVADGKLVKDFGEVHSDTIFSAKYSPDGRMIATCAADKTIRTFDVASGTRLRNFEGHTHHVLGVSWRDDGQTLASASADQTVKIWDVETGETRRTITGFAKEVTAITFVGTTPQMVTSGSDGQVRLYDSNNGGNVRTFAGAKDSIYAVGVTSDGKSILAGGQEGVIYSWDVASGKLLQQTK